MTTTMVNPIETLDEYISKSDWRVNANANSRYSLGGMLGNASGKIVANYWLDKVYSGEEGEAHRNGDYHIHDLDMLSGYCAGWSLRQLLEEGFNGVPGTISSTPPKHFSSACGQIVNFLGSLQNEWAGAQAFSSFDTYMAPFVRLDSMDEDAVEQQLQELIFNLNVPSRWSCQAPFSNLTFDLVCPDDLREENPVIGGKPVDFTYGELQEEMNMINRAFIKVMMGGDANGRVFTFPIPTYNITDDFDWDSKEADMLFDMTAKYGLPYFSNFMNSDLDPHMIRSMCPLRGDQKVLLRAGDNWVLDAISNVWKKYGQNQEKLYVLMDGKEKRAQINRFTNRQFYKLTFSNGHQVIVSEEHLNLTLDGDKETREVTTLDYMPFNTKATVSNRQPSDGTLAGKILASEEYGKRDIPEKAAKYFNGKKINMDIFNESRRFRNDMLIGAATSFSGGHRAIKTFSAEQRDILAAIAASIGVLTVKPGVDNTLEIVGAKDTCVESGMDCVVRDGRIWFRVADIEKLPEREDGYCFEVVGEKQSPYFMLPSGLVTHNCRLRLDLTELLKRGNGLFGSGEKTGSIGVVTLNLARIGHQYKGDMDRFMKQVDYLIDLASSTLEKKRVLVLELMDKGMYPYTKRYLGHLNNHFSTIGINGMNEAIRNFTDDQHDIADDYGEEFSLKVLEHIRERMVELQNKTGHMYNLEATPGEGACYRFAREDRKRFPDIIQAGTKEQPYYTNSSQLPVGYTNDPFLAEAKQEKMQVEYTGGTVLHLYMGEAMVSGEACKQLVKRSLQNFRSPYITVTPTFSICPSHGYISGEQFQCPQCADAGVEQDCEVWTRVMGYFRPVSSFNTGKKGEFKERQYFSRDLVA